MALKISEEAAVQMPMKTVASLICMVAIGTWAYFGIIETQNKISTTLELTEPTDHTSGDDGGKLKYKIIWGSTKHND